MKIPVRLIGVKNYYRVKSVNDNISKLIGWSGGFTGYTKLTDEEADKFGVVNSDNVFLELYETELVLYNQETVTLTHIDIKVDDELYHMYDESKDDCTVSNIICTLFNNRDNSRADLDIDILSYNETYKSIDEFGVQVVIDTEDLITIGSFTAPQSIVRHSSDIIIPYSSGMELPEDEDSANMMELLDASGQECLLTAEEIATIFGIKFGREVFIEYNDEKEEAIWHNL